MLHPSLPDRKKRLVRCKQHRGRRRFCRICHNGLSRRCVLFRCIGSTHGEECHDQQNKACQKDNAGDLVLLPGQRLASAFALPLVVLDHVVGPKTAKSQDQKADEDQDPGACTSFYRAAAKPGTQKSQSGENVDFFHKDPSVKRITLSIPLSTNFDKRRSAD